MQFYELHFERIGVFIDVVSTAHTDKLAFSHTSSARLKCDYMRDVTKSKKSLLVTLSQKCDYMRDLTFSHISWKNVTKSGQKNSLLVTLFSEM